MYDRGNCVHYAARAATGSGDHLLWVDVFKGEVMGEVPQRWISISTGLRIFIFVSLSSRMS